VSIIVGSTPFGVHLIADPAVPEGTIYIVPKMLDDETEEEWMNRIAVITGVTP